MKLFQEPIEVQVRDGLPVALRWRGCIYRVAQVLQEWAWRGRWWTDARLRGESRHYFRVTCALSSRGHRRFRPLPPSTSLDIYERAGAWVLTRVLD